MERWMDRALKVKITKEKLKNYNLEGSVTLLDTVMQKYIVCNIIA